MYIDFEDHRPEIPRVPQVASWRTGATVSLGLHALAVALLVFGPGMIAAATSSAAPAPLVAPNQQIRYVQIAPRLDRPAPPVRPAVASDLDRRSATRERAPKPANDQPFMRGNSPERIEGNNGERAIAPAPPAAAAAAATPPETPPATATTAPPTTPDGVLPATPPAAPSTTPGLASSLRNLREFFRTQNFDNQQGGQTEPSTDIQFDSKGVDFGPWLRRFKVKVENNWIIPQAALTNRGRVVLQFLVHRDGRITDLRIIQAASVNALTTSAFNAIQMSNPTLPLPQEYPADFVLFTVTFHYNDR
jgi:TonB family protein